MEIQERIGRRFREAREEKGWTQEDVGAAVGQYLSRRWTKQTVSAAEAGGRVFDAEDLLVISLVLKKRMDWFFTLQSPAASMDEVDQVQLPNGFSLPEATIAQAVGLPMQETRRISEDLHKIASEIAALRPEDER